MSKKVLILGGTRFFGLHLMHALVKAGDEVIVATRGLQDFYLKDKVKHVKCDRNNLADLKEVASLGPFDIIFDQICMSGKNASEACEAFRGTCHKYVMTSTGSVYDGVKQDVFSEDHFNPKLHVIDPLKQEPHFYPEDKRQAEAIFTQKATFPVCLVRLPIVIGSDDYTKRFKFHVLRNLRGLHYFVPNLQAKICFIDSHDAGEFLNFIGKSSFIGPINAVSEGRFTISELLKLIADQTHSKEILTDKVVDENHSPYGFAQDFVMDNSLAKKSGFKFSDLNIKIPELIKIYIERLK